MLRMRLFVAAVAAVAASLALFTQLAVAEPASTGGQAKPTAGGIHSGRPIAADISILGARSDQ